MEARRFNFFKDFFLKIFMPYVLIDIKWIRQQKIIIISRNHLIISDDHFYTQIVYSNVF